MTDTVWEPLAEIELNLSGSKNFQIYCLCSRAFIRGKIKDNNWGILIKGKPEQSDMLSEPGIDICDPEKHHVEFHNFKKQEVEVASCYCSASHYSTDDYESVTQKSTSDHQGTSKEHLILCPLQNSDSGADLSEHFVDKSYCRVSEDLDLPCNFSKSKLEAAWEKYWSENGEGIIWKSWIEKYGAYINPNYLEQNLLDESINEGEKESLSENRVDTNKLLMEVNSKTSTHESTKEEAVMENLEKIPDLKISSYPSCGSLLEVADTVKANIYVDESDSEDKILKSNSFGSYASYEKVKYVGSDYDKLKSIDSERVRSRCSNTNLSVKSIANTTVTTDSMTNVTKITLSSLDLSCECESVKSSSLLSTSSDDSSRLSSTSSSSSKEEICTEADMWWRKVWKEHYEDQYTSSYQIFVKNFYQNSDLEVNDSKNAIENKKKKFINKVDEEIENVETKNAVKAQHHSNSVSYILQKFDKASLKSDLDMSCHRNDLGNQFMNDSPEVITDSSRSPIRSDSLKRQLENSDDSLDDIEEVDGRCRKKAYQRQSSEMEKLQRKSAGKMDSIKQAMALMGFSFKADSNEIQSGYVTYRKKNIRGQNRRLKLCDTKPRTHLFFDDDGNSFKARPSETADSPQPSDEVYDKLEDDITKSEYNFVEPESLGYEAHSSSVEDLDGIIDENKKQKKKKKRQRKYSVPQEILDNKTLIKYWLRRYQLFSKFDKGVKLDTESWFSVTPEKLARHHADRCRCDVIVDAFCGAGGNSIQFAFTCERVIAIDIDPIKVEMARHNAKIYGVEDRIEFIVGDFIKLASKLQADVVFLSPPWGGPEYISHDVYSLENILRPLGGKALFHLASAITDNVAYFLPKNANSTDLALLCGPGREVEIEQNFVDRRLRSVTAYFGGLIMDPEDPYL